MSISASLVKTLRERTGAGMMECKKALVETDGDIELAVENLRKSGQAKADKKAGRVAAEGAVVIASSADGSRAAVAEINCETDFVAKEEDFKDFCQAVADRALSLDASDVPTLLSSTLREGQAQTVDERRRELIAKIGENIEVRRVQVVHASGGRLGTYLHGTRIGTVVDLSGGDEALAK
ncbi:MAG: translation elongation factor Ts, partial [Gammaproteobacteria bacterium]|nr:translation elongation factor Ts [Gammaproteobacteria bacterium]